MRHNKYNTNILGKKFSLAESSPWLTYQNYKNECISQESWPRLTYQHYKREYIRPGSWPCVTVVPVWDFSEWLKAKTVPLQKAERRPCWPANVWGPWILTTSVYASSGNRRTLWSNMTSYTSCFPVVIRQDSTLQTTLSLGSKIWPLICNSCCVPLQAP